MNEEPIMKSSIEKLYELSNKASRKILGLMSGTSLDGLDIALCNIEGAGKKVKVTLLQFETLPYTDSFQKRIRNLISNQNVSLQKLTLMNAFIAQVHANLVNQALKKWNLSTEDIDLIASHGQTIFHAPKNFHHDNDIANATLQLGDGDHIAALTGITTISDFRQKHIAFGGEGAPLVCYGDFLLFRHATKNRILLNIGGIANITYLPANCEFNQVIATDTGPGNGLMDAWMRKYFPGKKFDENGKIASTGQVAQALLAVMKKNPFFSLPLPKTTGAETFNIDYLENCIKKINLNNLKNNDVLTTLNQLTCITIYETIQNIISGNPNCEIILSGGGLHNETLMRGLKQLLPAYTFLTTADLNINPDAKEAILFALLANETLSGNEETFQGNVEHPLNISLGKISLPF